MNTESEPVRTDACGLKTTRTDDTERQYLRECRSLLARSCSDHDCDDGARLYIAAKWISEKDGVWSSSTIRMYRAALGAGLDAWVAAGMDVHGDRAPVIRAEIAAAKPPPASRSEPRKTSGKNRLTFSEEERNNLLVLLRSKGSRTSALLAGLLVFGTMFAARPCEWRTAHIKGGYLVIDCAKATNGRAVAETRTICLKKLSPIARKEVGRFVAAFRKAASEAEFWTRYHERLAKALHRACKELKMEPICLYTLRQQGAATAKLHMQPAEVAAHLGHKCITTSQRNYARKSSGWRTDPRVRPSAETVRKIKQIYPSDNGKYQPRFLGLRLRAVRLHRVLLNPLMDTIGSVLTNMANRLGIACEGGHARARTMRWTHNARERNRFSVSRSRCGAKAQAQCRANS